MYVPNPIQSQKNNKSKLFLVVKWSGPLCQNQNILELESANPAHLLRPKEISQVVFDLMYSLESLNSPYPTLLIARGGESSGTGLC